MAFAAKFIRLHKTVHSNIQRFELLPTEFAVMADEAVNSDPILPHLEQLLQKRQHPKTLCPSEVARALSQEQLKEAGVSSWRDLMPYLRNLAFQMRDNGEVEILQKGNVLPSDQTLEQTTGPIRIRTTQSS